MYSQFTLTAEEAASRINTYRQYGTLSSLIKILTTCHEYPAAVGHWTRK